MGMGFAFNEVGLQKCMTNSRKKQSIQFEILFIDLKISVLRIIGISITNYCIQVYPITNI